MLYLRTTLFCIEDTQIVLIITNHFFEEKKSLRDFAEDSSLRIGVQLIAFSLSHTLTSHQKNVC